MSYSSTILADSPLVYWKLDETTGATVFADTSGNSRTATIGGTPTYSTTNKVDTGSVGFSFTQYGYVGSAPWLSSTSTYSVEAWFSTTISGSRALLMYDQSSHGPGAPDRFFMFYISNGAVIFNPFNSGGGYVTLTSPSASYSDGIWHHAVGTWDGTTVKLYVDGVLVNSTALSGVSPTGVGAPVTIGAGCNNGLGNYLQYSGSLDEAAIYGTTLNSTQVTAHYSAGIANLPSQARTETIYAESLSSGTPTAQVEMLSVQGLIRGTSVAQAESIFLEALIPVLPTQVESVYAESVLSSSPPARIESTYEEVLLSIAAPTVVESSYLEVILLPRAVQRFVGWGRPI